MKILLRVLQIVYCLYALALFIVLMFYILPFVFAFALFSKPRSGNLLYTACAYWAKIWCIMVGIRHSELYEAPHDTLKQYIFVANHISYMDIPAAVRCIHQPVRALGKYEMVKYPIFGIIYKATVVLVDRKSAHKRAESVRALKTVLQQGVSIFIFPEGTFNETSHPLKGFYDGAFRIAIETQTPIKPILFLDTHERMHYRGFFELTPGRSRVVYLQEVNVQGYSIDQLHELKQKVYNQMEEGLRRYKTYPAQA